ncbi:MAG: gliding motility-associated C-terminal domain-containing protein [Bacteroidales bacterium]
MVYRQGPTGFDSIGYSNVPAYVDTGLKNGQEYCYKIRSIGQYTVPGLVFPIINNSQEKCGIPMWTIFTPCSPALTVGTNCETFINELSWIYPDTCLDEDVVYYIYYASNSSSDYIILDSTVLDYYTFSTNPPSVVGCFAVTALDSLWNESNYSNLECVDINACGRIWFPIVFTPNADGYNDFFFADSVNSVDINKFRLTIFNRWGGIVYETDDPYFKWDGRDQQNNKECVPGTYFYEGTVGEFSLRGPVERQVRGSLTLLR